MLTKRYDIYVGLANKDSLTQNEENQQMTSDLKKFFCEIHIPFSIVRLRGGYVHEDGTFVNEDSIRITHIGIVTDEQINNFVSAVKKIYHQESVLLVISDTNVNYMEDI